MMEIPGYTIPEKTAFREYKITLHCCLAILIYEFCEKCSIEHYVLYPCKPRNIGAMFIK